MHAGCIEEFAATATENNCPSCRRSLLPMGRHVLAARMPEHTAVSNLGLCTVCQEDIRPGEVTRTVPPCSHTFHGPCIMQWLLQRPVCPNCNADALEVRPAPPLAVGDANNVEGQQEVFAASQREHAARAEAGHHEDARVEVVRANAAETDGDVAELEERAHLERAEHDAGDVDDDEQEWP